MFLEGRGGLAVAERVKKGRGLGRARTLVVRETRAPFPEEGGGNVSFASGGSLESSALGPASRF